MKEMKYTAMEEKPILLDKGITNSYRWCIVSQGTHPTAYVAVTKEHPYYQKQYDDCDIDIHGGLTFCDDKLSSVTNIKKLWWLGWDYAHVGDYYAHVGDYLPYSVGDYLPYSVGENKKKWTTKEIKNHVMDVIEQLHDKMPKLNIREDGRIERICKHGIGHTIKIPKGIKKSEREVWFIHGCDGCCKDFGRILSI